MIARISPRRLSGTAVIPSSKSCAHRLLIAAALCDVPTRVKLNAMNDDISATARCLHALGAKIMQTREGLDVQPIARPCGSPQTLFCGESGSTLRFLLPVAAALGARCTFTGCGRLPERPNAPLIEALRAHGVHADADLLPLSLSGTLMGGDYALPGNISSQYISGLLLALPLCKQDSVLRLTTPLQSASYVDITLEVLRQFSIRMEATGEGWLIPGNQKYRSPGVVQVEGDWSGAAFWLAANEMGSHVHCEGLSERSTQGDRAIRAHLSALGDVIDVSDTPDLAPVLAVAATAHPGITRITGAARLRLKESDRLSTVTRMLHALNGRVEELEDGWIIHGGPLSGGTVEGCNDHRIVMSAAIAATVASGEVVVTDAQSIHKSYPDFFETYNALGGCAHVEPDR